MIDAGGSSTAASGAGTVEQSQSIAHRYVETTQLSDTTYADGIARFMLGRGILKLELYRVVGYDNNTKEELRAFSGTIALPLLATTEIADVLRQVRKTVSAMTKK